MEIHPLQTSQAFSALHLLRHAAPKLPSDFVGLGIVFYDSLMALPHLQLEVVGDERFDLLVQGLERICDVLAGDQAMSAAAEEGARDEGGRLESAGEGLSKLLDPSGAASAIFCHDRDRALADDGLALMGLDHPIVKGWMRVARESAPETLGISISIPDKSGVLSLLHVVATNEKGHRVSSVVALAVDPEGKRSPPLEKAADEVFHAEPAAPGLSREEARTVLTDVLEPMLLRDLSHRGVVREGQPYQAELVGWVEVSRK